MNPHHPFGSSSNQMNQSNIYGIYPPPPPHTNAPGAVATTGSQHAPIPGYHQQHMMPYPTQQHQLQNAVYSTSAQQQQPPSQQGYAPIPGGIPPGYQPYPGQQQQSQPPLPGTAGTIQSSYNPMQTQQMYHQMHMMPPRRTSELSASSSADTSDHYLVSECFYPAQVDAKPQFLDAIQQAKHSIQFSSKYGYLAAESHGYLCYSSKNTYLKLINLDHASQAKLRGHESEIIDIVFSPEQQISKIDPTECHFASLDANSKIILWNARFDREKGEILYGYRLSIGLDEKIPIPFQRIFWFPSTPNVPSQIIVVSGSKFYPVRVDEITMEKARLYRFSPQRSNAGLSAVDVNDKLSPVPVTFIAPEVSVQRGRIVDVSLSLSGKEFVVSTSDSSVLYVDRETNVIVKEISLGLIPSEQLSMATDFSLDTGKSLMSEPLIVTSSFNNTRLTLWKGYKCLHEIRVNQSDSGNENENRVIISNLRRVIIVADINSPTITLVRVDPSRLIFSQVVKFHTDDKVIDIIPILPSSATPDVISFTWVSSSLVAKYSLNCTDAFNDPTFSIDISQLPNKHLKIPKLIDIHRASSELNMKPNMYSAPPGMPMDKQSPMFYQQQVANYYLDSNPGIPPTPNSTPVVNPRVKRPQDVPYPDQNLNTLRAQKSASSSSILSSSSSKPVLMAPPGANLLRPAQIVNEDRSTVMSFASVGATGSLTHDSGDENDISDGEDVEDGEINDDRETSTQDDRIGNEKMRNRHDIVEDSSFADELKNAIDEFANNQSKQNKDSWALLTETADVVPEALKITFDSAFENAVTNDSIQDQITSTVRNELQDDIREISREIINETVPKIIKEAVQSEIRSIMQEFGNSFTKELFIQTQSIFLQSFENTLIPQMELEFRRGVLDVNNEDLRNLKECLKKNDLSTAIEITLRIDENVPKYLRELGDPSQLKLEKVDDQVLITFVDKIRVSLGSSKDRALALSWVRYLIKAMKMKNKQSPGYAAVGESVMKWLNEISNPNHDEKNHINPIRQLIKSKGLIESISSPVVSAAT